MAETLKEFLDRTVQSGRPVPFALAARYMHEQHVAGLPEAPVPAAPPLPAFLLSPPPPPAVTPLALAPGVPADPRLMHGSFNTVPPQGGTLHYRDAGIGTEWRADWINVKDYGAKLDGTNDSAAFTAAYNAAPANGTIFVPRGVYSAPSFAPPVTGKYVRWVLDGNKTSTGADIAYLGDGDVLETYLGRKRFAKRLTTSTAGYAVVEIVLDNSTPNISSGVVAGLVTTATSQTDATGFTWAHNVTLFSHATGGASTQDVGIASTVRAYGGSANWQFAGSTYDLSGLAPTNQLVGMELNAQANGPDHVDSGFNPTIGSRAMLHIPVNAYNHPAWAASVVRAVGAVVQPSPANGFTYVCTVAGTSGTVQPTWPTSAGTVVDGTATWKYGTTVAAQYAKGISIGSGANTSIGAGFHATGTYYDAILEMSAASLADGGVADAGIRMAANMPIDFSANQTLAGQNVRTLRYRSSDTRLVYNSAGTDLWAMTDAGRLSLGVLPTNAVSDATASAAGVPVGGVLQERVGFTNQGCMSPDDEIAVKLTAAQWQTMLAILAEQSFKVAAPLIQAIQQRCVQFETELGRDEDRVVRLMPEDDRPLATKLALLKQSFAAHVEMCARRGVRLERLVWGMIIVMLGIIGFLAEKVLK